MAADTKRGAVWAVVNTKHNGVMLSVDDLREQLAAQGLHIVTAADNAVLDAWAKMPTSILGDMSRTCEGPPNWVKAMLATIEAELARREQKA